jgi:large subunit ribosomal protein L21
MYAIIETGGKQFKVKKGAKVRVAKLSAEVGSDVTISNVLMVGGESLKIGSPYLKGAEVTATVLEHGRGDKILVFKKWRRNDSRKLRGHRQDFTCIKITDIKV